MADATFDDTNLLVLLPPAQTFVDIRSEVYSAWKEHRLASLDNRRAPIAFTTEGGTDTVPGEVSGRNYFLRNDLGWRIRPSEEDLERTLVGNLFPADATLPMIVPTLGAFTTSTVIQRSSLALVETPPAGLDVNVTKWLGAAVSSPGGTPGIPDMNVFSIGQDTQAAVVLGRWLGPGFGGQSDSGTLTTIVDVSLGGQGRPDDIFRGYMIMFTAGALRGEFRIVVDWDLASNTLTFAPPLPTAPFTDNYVLVPATLGLQLLDLWQRQGLDLASPAVFTSSSVVAGDVDQTLTGDGVTSTTVTRNP